MMDVQQQYLTSTSRENTKTRVRTYQPQLLSQLISDANTQGINHEQERTQSEPGHQTRSRWERSLAQRQAKDAIRTAREQAFMQATQAKKQAAENAKDAEFERDYASVLAGISCTDGSHIMAETQSVLDHKQKIKDRKQTTLYNEWSTEVFDKIQGRLQHAVDKRTGKEILTRLKSQMDEYLATTNTKLGVYRDVIIEDDYDPLKPHQHDIKVYTGDIRDPVKRDVLKPQYERALMGVSASCDALPLGKHTLDTKMWGDLAIHSTPYGHNVDSTGNGVMVTMSERAVAGRKSRIPMDHYGFPMGDNQAAAQEMGRPGKRSGLEATVQGGRKDLYDVLQQTCHQRPGFTGGDRWLEAKGKGSAPGPEQRRGRGDLSEVLNQASNPYQDGRSLGDQWLESRGKAMPPGPEQRRGRMDLTDTLQQRPLTNTVSRQPLGDQWLDAKGKGTDAPGPKETVREFLFRSDCDPDPAKVKDPRRYQSVIVCDKTMHPGQ